MISAVEIMFKVDLKVRTVYGRIDVIPQHSKRIYHVQWRVNSGGLRVEMCFDIIVPSRSELYFIVYE